MYNDRILLSPPHMDGRELDYIRRAFEQNHIAPVGDQLNQFEDELARYTGAGHAAALSSGTAALHLALLISGIGEGDEVLCPTFTYAATLFPVRYQRATPILVDSEPETWNMDPQLLEDAIRDRLKRGGRPKAIIPVHLFGVPALMEEIMEVARKYELVVIEDAAESLGSKYRDQHTGTIADFGVLSFNGNKLITTSGGGALISDDQAGVEKARYLATQARDQQPYYHHREIGYNYRMSNVLAAIGRGQLEVIEERLKLRRRHFTAYRQALHSQPGISFPDEPAHTFCNRWLTTVIINPQHTGGITREQLRSELEEQYIETRPLWKPMHQQPVFESCPFYSNGVSDRLYEQGLCLPSGSAMSEEARNKVITGLIKGLSQS